MQFLSRLGVRLVTSVLVLVCIPIKTDIGRVLQSLTNILCLGLLRVVNSIPSDFTVGTAQISVPLVRVLKSSLGSIVEIAVGVSTAMTVLLSIGCAAAGLTSLASGQWTVPSNSHVATLRFLTS